MRIGSRSILAPAVAAAIGFTTLASTASAVVVLEDNIQLSFSTARFGVGNTLDESGPPIFDAGARGYTRTATGTFNNNGAGGVNTPTGKSLNVAWTSGAFGGNGWVLEEQVTNGSDESRVDVTTLGSPTLKGSFYYLIPTGDPIPGVFHIRFFNGVDKNVDIASSPFSLTADGTWHQAVLDLPIRSAADRLADAGANNQGDINVVTVLAFDLNGGVGRGDIYFDHFEINGAAIPEPAALGLLAPAALALARRRR